MHGSVRFALRSYPGESRYERNECAALGNGFPDSSGGVVVTDLGAFDNAFSVALQPDVLDPQNPRIIVSGSTGFGGTTSVALLRYTAGGVLDSSFGSGGVVTAS